MTLKYVLDILDIFVLLSIAISGHEVLSDITTGERILSAIGVAFGFAYCLSRIHGF